MKTTDYIADKGIERECEYAYMRAKVLGGGRSPIAHAELCGEGKNEAVRGSVSFFYTPIGVLVCAAIRGLEGGYAYRMALCAEDGEELELPSIYNRNGVGWCADITSKLTPRRLDGGKISVCRSGGSFPCLAAGLVK